MGSSNRDYMQDEYDDTRGPAWGHDVPSTKWLIVTTVGVFILQAILIPQILTWGRLSPNDVIGGQIWRLVTYVFCYDPMNAVGLVFDMLIVWFLGSTLERMYGSREILWYYLASALACGLIFTTFGMTLKSLRPLLGAGSCVAALLMLYAMHFPRREILVMFIIPVEIRVLVGIYIALHAYTILQAYSGRVGFEAIAYMSGLWGIGFGYLYRRFNWHFSDMMEWFDLRKLQQFIRRAKAGRRLKVYAPEPMTNLDEQVDAILAKIHEQGSESLTDRERSILQKASEQAKNRL